MKRNFVLPAAIVLCLHAVLLLGFRSSPYTPPLHVSSTTQVIAVPLSLTPDTPPPPEDAGAKATTTSLLNNQIIPEAMPPDIHTPFEIRPSRQPAGPPSPALVTPHFQLNGPGEDEFESGPLAASLLENSPRALQQVAPQYPYGARSRGENGEVTVEFDVDIHGNVSNPHVVRSTAMEFEAPTLQAIRHWKFEVGRKNGKIVPFRMALPVRFNISQ